MSVFWIGFMGVTLVFGRDPLKINQKDLIDKYQRTSTISNVGSLFPPFCYSLTLFYASLRFCLNYGEL